MTDIDQQLLHEFQSTLSMRRATDRLDTTRYNDTISIHALHEESDYVRCSSPSFRPISIHALHEESDIPSADLIIRET